MNAVEIEEAISELAMQPFDAGEFPFAFLRAFANKETTIKRLKSGTTNKSDVGGVLQTNHIHIKCCDEGDVESALSALRQSPASTKFKADYILATDGKSFEAENLVNGEVVACEYSKFPDQFSFFLSLAGISTVKEIRENAFDIKATGRLNRLYIELLKTNPDWATAERRSDMNHFMARLIFCFFSEDTDIFSKPDMFTDTVRTMSESDSSNTHEIIQELFRAMNTNFDDRDKEGVARWANVFPYVNGGLFAGGLEVPKFSKIARSYLLHIGELDWQKINPDIFGSMIQAVADDEERGELGMHYTSVPNILKVLNPLFLDELREQLEEAEDNGRKLLNLRNRLAKIRVFDPACGSGNFLVIAYKEMREIEAEINRRRNEKENRTVIPITNFRGIELRDFSAEIARLALIIAEYQCDVLYRGQKEAIQDFLPLRNENWITSGNALKIDWLSVCPPTGETVKHRADDLFFEAKEEHQIDFENEGGETYICGNPPYIGTKYQSAIHKDEIKEIFGNESLTFGNVDYIGCWFLLSARMLKKFSGCSFAFVSTSSLFQGEQTEIVLYILKSYSLQISWVHSSFMWSNNAMKNAGVTCCVVGCVPADLKIEKNIFQEDQKRKVWNIGPYLVPMPNIVVTKRQRSLSEFNQMKYGSMSNDKGIFDFELNDFLNTKVKFPELSKLIKITVGGAEFIRGIVRRSLYIDEDTKISEELIKCFEKRFEGVKNYRQQSNRAATRKLSEIPMFFAERRHINERKFFIPQVLSERREYLTIGLLEPETLVIAPHMQIIDGDLFEFSILSSKQHHIWVATVCGRLKTDIRYSSLLGWNTFPVPTLTEKNKEDLIRCAEDILLAREAHFPATIADLYDPENMPENLREAHDRNDEVLERIYIGRRFKNDTERLEKLFELYVKMTEAPQKLEFNS